MVLSASPLYPIVKFPWSGQRTFLIRQIILLHCTEKSTVLLCLKPCLTQALVSPSRLYPGILSLISPHQAFFPRTELCSQSPLFGMNFLHYTMFPPPCFSLNVTSEKPTLTTHLNKCPRVITSPASYYFPHYLLQSIYIFLRENLCSDYDFIYFLHGRLPGEISITSDMQMTLL